MKITLLQENLKTALSHIQKAIPSKPQLPILNHISCAVAQNSLTLSTTDLFFGITTKVACKSDDEGAFAVPGDVFCRFLLSLNPGEVILETEGTQLTITAKDIKTTLTIQGVEEFPHFPQIESEGITIATDVLQTLQQNIAFAVTIDQTRPVLTSLLFQPLEEGVEVVATDGFRLTTLQFPHLSVSSKPLLLPAKALSEVLRIAVQLSVETITIRLATELQQIVCGVGGTEMYVRMIEGEFPPYNKIIPQSFEHVFTCDGGELQSQLKRAMVFGRDISNIISIQVEGEQLKISAKSPTYGTFTGMLNIERKIGDTDVSIAFNANYLLEFIQSCKPETLEISLNDSLKPAQFRPSNLEGYRYIVMPFRIQT